MRYEQYFLRGAVFRVRLENSGISFCIAIGVGKTTVDLEYFDSTGTEFSCVGILRSE
jgi:hypothetical protein